MESVPVVNGTDLGLMGGVKEALWIEVPHEAHRKHLTLESSDYAEVDTQNLSSFYNSRKETLTPYATTILVPNRQDTCSVSVIFRKVVCGIFYNVYLFFV